MSGGIWHPKAKRIHAPDDGGSFTGGGWKFCVHTTEGRGADGAIQAFKANDSWPHFLLGITGAGNRILYQFISLDRAARSLRHTFTQETNRANCIQVEVIGFAAESHKWRPELYRFLHLLMVYAHRHVGVPMESHHPFIGQDGYHRLSPNGWVKTIGLVGHCHCPGNDHVDPGNLDIAKVIG